jgi:hypothetical protein
MMTFPMVLSLLYVKAFLFAVLLVLVAVGYLSGHSQLDWRVGLWALGLAARGRKQISRAVTRHAATES